MWVGWGCCNLVAWECLDEYDLCQITWRTSGYGRISCGVNPSEKVTCTDASPFQGNFEQPCYTLNNYPFTPLLNVLIDCWHKLYPNIMSAEELQDGLCDLTLVIKVWNQTHELQMNFNEDSNIRSMNYSLSSKYISTITSSNRTFQSPYSKWCNASWHL